MPKLQTIEFTLFNEKAQIVKLVFGSGDCFVAPLRVAPHNHSKFYYVSFCSLMLLNTWTRHCGCSEAILIPYRKSIYRMVKAMPWHGPTRKPIENAGPRHGVAAHNPLGGG